MATEPGGKQSGMIGRVTAAPHPLDPVTADEIRAAVALLRAQGHAGPGWRIASVELREPAKDVVRAHTAGDPVHREAVVICWNRADGMTYKALVSLTDEKIVSWLPQPGHQANATVDEYHEAEAALLADEGVRAALAARGVTDLDLVLFDVWTFGHHVIPEAYRELRVGWADVWFRDSPNGNPYAHLISGLKPILDLNTMLVLEIEDQPGAGPKPVMAEYVPELVAGQVQRDDLKTLEIVQPDGVSFELDGHGLRWQRWSL